MASFEAEAKDSEQVHIGSINCAPPFTLQREDFNTCGNGIDRHMVRRFEKTVSVDPLSSRGINKFHLEGDFHLESDIEAIKVYECLSKLSRSFASWVIKAIWIQLEQHQWYEKQWGNQATHASGH